MQAGSLGIGIFWTLRQPFLIEWGESKAGVLGGDGISWMPPRKGDRQKMAGAGGLHEMKSTMQIGPGGVQSPPHTCQSNQRRSSSGGRNKEMGRYRDRQGDTRVSDQKKKKKKKTPATHSLPGTAQLIVIV